MQKLLDTIDPTPSLVAELQRFDTEEPWAFETPDYDSAAIDPADIDHDYVPPADAIGAGCT